MNTVIIIGVGPEAGLVDAYEYLYKQPRPAWAFEVDVRTSLERW